MQRQAIDRAATIINNLLGLIKKIVVYDNRSTTDTFT